MALRASSVDLPCAPVTSSRDHGGFLRPPCSSPADSSARQHPGSGTLPRRSRSASDRPAPGIRGRRFGRGP